MDPPRAKPKLLNKALLSDIASTAAEKQLTSTDRAKSVAGLYMLNKRFNGKVLRHLEKCDSAELWPAIVSLHGGNKKSHLELDPKLFKALVEHSGLVIPTVALSVGFGGLSKLQLIGVESLKLVCQEDTWAWRQGLDHLVRVIAENKSSLRALLDVPQRLFDRLPPGLELDEFSTCNVHPRDVKIPALNTKVFKYDIADSMEIPLAFMRTVNAEEIHVQIHRLLPFSPMKTFGAKPANNRTKKLRVKFVHEDVSSLDFGRMFREVADFCPKLECFELVHEKHFKDTFDYDNPYTWDAFTHAVDDLVVGFERALKEADIAPYNVHLKAHVWYTYNAWHWRPVEADFTCGLLKTDLPPSEEVEPGKQHSYFVKEKSTDSKSLRVDCEIVIRTESDGGFDFKQCGQGIRRWHPWIGY